MTTTVRRVGVLDQKLTTVFGVDDAIEDVDRRALAAYPDVATIVWEGDPQTFQFSFVSARVVELLGWPRSRWTGEATFWADHVVHERDKVEAVAFCALATGRGADHVFEYRARKQDGGVLWLRDYVKVVVGPRGVPTALRGVMFDITAERRAASRFDDASQMQRPTRAELLAIPPNGADAAGG